MSYAAMAELQANDPRDAVKRQTVWKMLGQTPNARWNLWSWEIANDNFRQER